MSLMGCITCLGMSETETAAMVLTNLACGSSTCNLIVKADVLTPLVALMNQSSEDMAKFATGALANLANSTDAVSEHIVAAGALPALVAMLNHSCDGGAGEAARALANLAIGGNARCDLIIEARALTNLVAILGRHLSDWVAEDTTEQAARVLANLAEGCDARCTLIVAAGGLAPLVALLSQTYVPVAEQAAGALNNLACGSTARISKINELDAASSLRPLLRYHPECSLARSLADTLRILEH